MARQLERTMQGEAEGPTSRTTPARRYLSSRTKPKPVGSLHFAPRPATVAIIRGVHRRVKGFRGICSGFAGFAEGRQRYRRQALGLLRRPFVAFRPFLVLRRSHGIGLLPVLVEPVGREVAIGTEEVWRVGHKVFVKSLNRQHSLA